MRSRFNSSARWGLVVFGGVVVLASQGRPVLDAGLEEGAGFADEPVGVQPQDGQRIRRLRGLIFNGGALMQSRQDVQTIHARGLRTNLHAG